MRARLSPEDALVSGCIRLVGAGRRAELKRTLDAHPHLLEARWDNRTLLSEACRNPRGVACARLLLARGADPNASSPDQPWLRPLRQAMENTPALVPDLLAAGARPQASFPERAWASERASDLAEALVRCPEHVPLLLAHGAPIEASDPQGTGRPLATAFRKCLEKGWAGPAGQASWRALQALVDAGADFRFDHSEQRTSPDWFWMWNFRFGSTGFLQPPAAERLCETLAGRMDRPGLRHRSQTFLHAIAATLSEHWGSQQMEEHWGAVLGCYAAGDLQQWVRQSEPLGWSVAALCISKRHQGDETVCAPSIVLLLERARRWFEPLGWDTNEPNERGRTAAHRFVEQWGWEALQQPSVRQALAPWGLDFHRPDRDGITAAQLLRQPRGHQPAPPAAKLTEALLEMALRSPDGARPRPRL